MTSSPGTLWLKRLAWGFVVIISGLILWAAVAFFRALNPPLPPHLQQLAKISLVAPGQQTGPALEKSLKPGVPTLISFWASWCGPCRQEASDLAALRRAYGPDRLTIVYLNIDAPAAYGAAHDFLVQTGAAALGFHPISGDTRQQLTRSKDIALPRTYLFDRQGQPQAAFSGYDPESGPRHLQAWAATGVWQ